MSSRIALFAATDVENVRRMIPTAKKIGADGDLVVYARSCVHAAFEEGLAPIEVRPIPTEGKLAFWRAIRKERFDAICVTWTGPYGSVANKVLPLAAKAFHVYAITDDCEARKVTWLNTLPVLWCHFVKNVRGALARTPDIPEVWFFAPGPKEMVDTALSRLEPIAKTRSIRVFLERELLDHPPDCGPHVEFELLPKRIPRVPIPTIAVLWNGLPSHRALKLSALLHSGDVFVVNENGDAFRLSLPKLISHSRWRMEALFRNLPGNGGGGASLPIGVRLLARVYSMSLGLLLRGIYLGLWQARMELLRYRRRR